MQNTLLVVQGLLAIAGQEVHLSVYVSVRLLLSSKFHNLKAHIRLNSALKEHFALKDHYALK